MRRQTAVNRTDTIRFRIGNGKGLQIRTRAWYSHSSMWKGVQSPCVEEQKSRVNRLECDVDASLYLCNVERIKIT